MSYNCSTFKTPESHTWSQLLLSVCHFNYSKQSPTLKSPPFTFYPGLFPSPSAIFFHHFPCPAKILPPIISYFLCLLVNIHLVKVHLYLNPFSGLHMINEISNHQAQKCSYQCLCLVGTQLLRHVSSTVVFTFSKTYRRSNCLSTHRLLKIFLVIYNFYQITQKEFKELRAVAITKLLTFIHLTYVKMILSTYIYKNF